MCNKYFGLDICWFSCKIVEASQLLEQFGDGTPFQKKGKSIFNTTENTVVMRKILSKFLRFEISSNSDS